jgi:hypothetical protein
VVAAVLEADHGGLARKSDQETVVDGSPLSFRGRGYVVERRELHDVACDMDRHRRRSVRRSNKAARLNEGEGRRNAEATRETQKAVCGIHF